MIARGSTDTDKLFVTGGSGDGLLTAEIRGKTGRFRASVVAKPSDHLVHPPTDRQRICLLLAVLAPQAARGPAEGDYRRPRHAQVPTALAGIPRASHATNQGPSQSISHVLHTAGGFERHRQREGAAAD